MKKVIATLMTVLFFGSMTAAVFAQAPATTTPAPAAKTMKHKKHTPKKVKKAAKPAVAPAAASTPAAK
jgi:hypothetical protein